MQLYILKLLKMQTKYLGRQWRKTNMKTLSAIYQKVRHRLNDDWAYGNDPDARPWDFQNDECALRNAVDFFNTRRYKPHELQTLPVIFIAVGLHSLNIFLALRMIFQTFWVTQHMYTQNFYPQMSLLAEWYK